MSDTSDTGTRPTDSTGDTGETGDTGAEPSGGTVEAGPAEEVILEVDGREIDVTADPNDAFPTGSQVPGFSPLQVMQMSSQGVLQQTPAVQIPAAQSASASHASPSQTLPPTSATTKAETLGGP